MWPGLNVVRDVLMEPRDIRGGNVAIEHEMQAAQMNPEGLIRVFSARVLDRVALHGQFVNLLEQ